MDQPNGNKHLKGNIGCFLLIASILLIVCPFLYFINHTASEVSETTRVIADVLEALGLCLLTFGVVLIQWKNVKDLIEALKDKNWRVRSNAAKALGKRKDARAVEPLIEALKDKDENVREAAKAALEKIKAK